MSKGWSFTSGQWLAICDSCGEKHKSGDLRKRWDGFMVCQPCWEPRHQQDFLRTRPDHQAVPWSRPQLVEAFRNVLGEVELLSITDTVQTLANYYLVVQDQFDVVDNFLTLRMFDASDSLSLTDSAQNSILVPVRDLVELDDDDDGQYFAESYLVDNYDYVKLGIVFNRSIVKIVSDSFSLADSALSSIIERVSDSITLTESIAKRDTTTKTDSLTLSESNAKSISRRATDSFTFSDSLTYVVLITKSLSDSFTLTESLVKRPSVAKTDTFTLTSAGTVNPPLYVDSTYFSSNFVNTQQLIT
jgi:hypothetical protein